VTPCDGTTNTLICLQLSSLLGTCVFRTIILLLEYDCTDVVSADVADMAILCCLKDQTRQLGLSRLGKHVRLYRLVGRIRSKRVLILTSATIY